MTRYLVLLSFTEQGIRDIKQTIARASDFRSAVQAAGGKVLSQYWSMGEADGCLVLEAPDDATAAGLLAALNQKGNVRTRSMRVFDEQETRKMLAGI